LKITQG